MRKLDVQPPARADIRNLLKTSRRRFGSRAKRDYKALIDRALALLCENPQRAGVARREELARAPYVFPLRHARTRGVSPKQPRHVIVFTYDDETLSILRVLHDSMDIAQRVSEDESEA
jgi:plasmid stabilization system protein ParE